MQQVEYVIQIPQALDVRVLFGISGGLNFVDFLHAFSFKVDHLTVDQQIRAILYRDRAREVVPVIIFWVAENALVAMLLLHMGWLNQQTALLWCLFCFVFDMVCVVLWCPLQLILMRNRCCTTCQIFNWDAIMVATPLLFVGGWFGWLLIALASAVLVRWELAALRHPERFDERTNARLSCAQCDDKLYYLRGPFRLKREERVDLLELVVSTEQKQFARRGAATVSVMARLPASFRLSRCTSCGAKTNLLLNESKRARAFVR